MIQVSVQHSKALPLHSSSQHLLCGHGGNSNCHGSSGNRRKCWSRTTQTPCANVSHWIYFTTSLHFTNFQASSYFLVILLLCKVSPKISRISAAWMKWRLCSDTFLLLINDKKYMHCQRRQQWEKTNGFSTPSLRISTQTQRQLCRIQSFVKNIGPKEPIYKASHLSSNISQFIKLRFFSCCIFHC